MENIINRQTKLWNRDFILLVFGQVVSLFGNMILSFALPLYILDISGSAALYGLVLSLPYVSLIIMSPVGGIIADRLKKQKIMFWLDVSTTVLIVSYMALSGLITAVVPLVIVKLMALNAIQGMYMPAVQAAVPSLAPADQLVSANAVVNIVNAFSNMAGMAVAGILLARFGLFPILAVSAVCFAITAGMDLLIRIPYKKQEMSGSVIQMVKSDISLSARLMFKEKPMLAKCAVIAFLITLTLASMIMVGIPVLVTQSLGFGMDYVGISSSIMMAGGMMGGIAAGILGSRLNIKNMPLTLGIGGIIFLPMGLVFLADTPAFMAYVIITAASVFGLAAIQMGSIQLIAFIQGETPTELVGKVMSLILILPFLANASGQLIYGVLFERFEAFPWIVVFVTVILTVLIAFYAHTQFKKS